MTSNGVTETSGLPSTPLTAGVSAADLQVHHRFEQVGDVKVFYREAGPRHAPTVVLLHGYAASSFMYRNLIPVLADGYRVIAPDLPGFGFTEAPRAGNMTTPSTSSPRPSDSSRGNWGWIATPCRCSTMAPR